MSERRARRLLDGTVVRLFEVSCRAPASGPGEDERSSITELIVPLRGCFEVHRGRDTTIADAASAVVFPAGEEHRVAHPAPGGDDCLVFALPWRTGSELVGPLPTGSAVVEPVVRLSAHRIRTALRRGVLDPFEAEDDALELVRSIGRAVRRRASSGGTPGRSQRAAVERARAVLASAPGARWRLDDVARESLVSPAHLARQFRLVTGESISRYLLRLRLGLALDDLAAGRSDLAGLAADLGFAHHSHFSARFRAVFGLAPSTVRRSLSSDRLERMRTIVTANPRQAP